ncbi:MAG: methylated-DNA--[protein]-cysteine S-methyltransferase [Bacteroidales bacterium]|nr:methylated-DNA--[protein]-cysteine S-methyltransferase [Bacteroidales bacterium]
MIHDSSPFICTHQTPVGVLTLFATGKQLTAIKFGDCRPVDFPGQPCQVVDEACRQLDSYFSGRLTAFDLPLLPAGTPFQKKVWHELLGIAYAHTISYKQLALALGGANLARAVGLANGQNPLPIVVPCHRVIGADGAMTGFAGGLNVKRWLLAHEQRTAGMVLF